MFPVSVLFEGSGEIVEEALVLAGPPFEYQTARGRPSVQAPGAEVLTTLETHRVAGRAARAVGYNYWHVG